MPLQVSRLRTHTLAFAAAPLLLAFCPGCAVFGPDTLDMSRYVRPTVAILDFENKASFPYDWNIGAGIRDMLVDELVKSGQYTVLTRRDLAAIVGELRLQDSDMFRPQGKPLPGQLKNVKYLVRGAVTDFTHVKGGWARAAASKLTFWGSRDTAVVGVTLHVIEVETGEILASESLEGRASAGEMSVGGAYKGVVFGGGAFYRTPLGKATRQVLNQAVAGIADAISRSPWQPRIVRSDGKTVYVSGGRDRGMSVGTVWDVLEAGEKLIDPETGDSLGRIGSTRVGRIRIISVGGKYSVAELTAGRCDVGQALAPSSIAAPR